jgi:outer membrane protein
MAEEVDSLQKQLQAQGDKLSPTEQASKAKAIDDKKKSAQRFAEDAQNDLQGEIQEIFQGVASKFYDVLETYAKEQGFTLVLDGTQSQQQAPVVLYATNAADISKAVVDAYNVKSGVPAPPPPAPGAQAAPKVAPKAPAATH